MYHSQYFLKDYDITVTMADVTTLCKCGNPAKYAEVQSESSPNRGRVFFACQVDKAKGGCGFFKWADGMPNLGPSNGGSKFGKFQKAKQNYSQPYNTKQSSWHPQPQFVKGGFSGTGASIPLDVSPSPSATPARTVEEKNDREVAVYLLAEKIDRVDKDYKEAYETILNKLNQITELLLNNIFVPAEQDNDATQEIVQ